MDSGLDRSRTALPQELVDMIIDFFLDDRDTLKACSLVCKAWVPRSQQHIHVRFNFDPCIRRFAPRYTSEEVARYVKIIQVSPSYTADDTRLPDEWEFLLRFHHVQKAVVYWELMGPSPISLTPSFLTVFAHTTHLTLCFGDIDELRPFYEFLFSFPVMTHLEFGRGIVFAVKSDHDNDLLDEEDTMFPAGHPFYTRILEFVSRLQCLKIFINDPDVVVKYLLPLFPVGHCSLKCLHLQGSQMDLTYAATLFARCAETLQSLGFYMSEEIEGSLHEALSASKDSYICFIVTCILKFSTAPVVQASTDCSA